MTKYEYSNRIWHEPIHLTNQLNEAAAQGWEVLTIVFECRPFSPAQYVAFLRRKVTSAHVESWPATTDLNSV